jgi:16S rRNA (uracil1498-N3)-methyltransferase
VTAPLFLLPESGLDGVGVGDEVALDGEEGRHAVAVRRIRPGEQIDLSDGVGGIARVRVQACSGTRLTARVLSLDHVAAPRPRLVLVQALAKGGRDELAVETATELGVDEIVPWQARRSVVVWDGPRGERSRRRWEATVRAAGKQSRRARLPQVGATVTNRQLMERLGTVAAAFVLHEEASDALASVPLPEPGHSGDLMILVGPEGGIDPDELTVFGDAGARAVRLGPLVLRTSTAGAAALAVLSARLGRWG